MLITGLVGQVFGVSTATCTIEGKLETTSNMLGSEL